MKTPVKFVGLFIIIIAAVLLPGCAGTEVANTSELPQTTEASGEAAEGQVLDVEVCLSLQSSLAKGVSFEDVMVQVGTLEKGPVWNPWGNDTEYYKGDPCLLLFGEIRNDTSDNLTVAGSVAGYNPDGEQVVWTLSSARIMGQFEYSVPAQSSRSFEVILSYAGDVPFIEVHAASYISETFYHPPITSTPLPASELTYITFSKQWLLANDVDPEPTTVKITFPVDWLEEPLPLGPDDEAVTLTVPTRMLQAHNESTNPDEITIVFPDYLFDGLAFAQTNE